jgi:hypothetical protein
MICLGQGTLDGSRHLKRASELTKQPVGRSTINSLSRVASRRKRKAIQQTIMQANTKNRYLTKEMQLEHIKFS